MPATTWRCSPAEVDGELEQLLGLRHRLGRRRRCATRRSTLPNSSKLMRPSSARGRVPSARGCARPSSAASARAAPSCDRRRCAGTAASPPGPRSCARCHAGHAVGSSTPSCARNASARSGITGSSRCDRTRQSSSTLPRISARGDVRLPRRLLIDVAVARAHQLPDRLERLGRLELVHRTWPYAVVTFVDGKRIRRRRRRHDAVLVHHAERAVEEVAEIVRQLGVVAADELLVVEVAVGAERDLAQHVIAEGVDADVVRQLQRIDDVAERLGHLVAVDGPPAVREDRRRQPPARGHEERRPVDGVEARDLFADHVHDLRRRIVPELLGLAPSGASPSSSCRARRATRR